MRKIIIKHQNQLFELPYYDSIQKAIQIKSGERWITVHPPGHEKGEVILVRENKDGTHSVIGGAGGALRHLRLTNVKSKEEYEKEHKEHRGKEAERRKSLTSDERSKENFEKKAQKNAKREVERKHIEKVRSRVGGVSEDIPDEKLFKLSPSAQKIQLARHHRKQISEAKKTLEEHKKQLLQNHLIRQKALEAGVTPEEIKALVLEEYEKPEKKTGETKGFSSDIKEKAKDVVVKELTELTPEALQKDKDNLVKAKETEHPATLLLEEAVGLKEKAHRIFKENPEEAVKLYQKSEKREAQYERVKDKDPDRALGTIARIRTSKKIKDELQKLLDLGELTPSFVPLRDSQIVDIMDTLRSERKLNGQLREIQKLEEPGGKKSDERRGVSLKYSDVTDEQILEDISNEAKESVAIDLARMLHGSIDENSRQHYKNLSNGQFNQLNNVMLSTLGQSLLDRDVLDVLGVQNTARLIRWKLQKEGKDIAGIAEAIEKYHKSQQKEITEEALEKSQTFLNKLNDFQHESLETGHDIAIAHEQNLKRQEILDSAQAVLTSTLGKLEATATVINTFKDKQPFELTLSFPGKDVDQIALHLRALGLTKNQMQVDPIEREITVKSDHFSSFFQNSIPPADRERNQKTLEIKAGKYDEEGYLPGGIKSRPYTTFTSENPEKQIVKTKNHLTIEKSTDSKKIRDKIENHIGREILGGKDIAQIETEMKAADFRGSSLPVGDGEIAKIYDSHLLDIFPSPLLRPTDYKEKLHTLADRMARNTGIVHGDKNYTFNTQQIDLDHPEIHEVAFRALADLPEGRFALKQPGDLSPQEQRHLRKYWQNEFGEAGKKADKRDKALLNISKSGKTWRYPKAEWTAYRNVAGGSDEAFKKIQSDIKDHALSDPTNVFKDVPKISMVDLNNLDSLITNTLSKSDQKLYRDALKQSPHRSDKFKKELQEKAQEKLKGHWDKEIMQFADEEIAQYHDDPIDPETAFNVSWNQYVKSHGGLAQAQETLLDHLKGKYVENFNRYYEGITGEKLETRNNLLPNWREHVFGSISEFRSKELQKKEKSQIFKEQAEVATRKTGKFQEEEGESRKQKAKRQKEELAAKQYEAFAKKIDYPVDHARQSAGTRAENQIGSLLTENLKQAFSDNRKTKLLKNLSMSGRFVNQQRAVKMIENQKRLYLAKGVGSGKTAMQIAGFTNLHSKGQAKRAIFLVPTQVQGQFGEEMRNITKPGRYRWNATPGQKFSERLKAYQDPETHMVAVTHQTFRDDMLKLMAKDHGTTPREMLRNFVSLPDAERVKMIGETMRNNGMSDFNYAAVDEAHMLSNRHGKEEAILAAIIDSATHPDNMPYYVAASGTPVKNDVSESHDILKKIAPHQYPDELAFGKKYGVDVFRSQEALRREIAPHVFSGRIDPNVNITRKNNPYIDENGKKQGRDFLPLTDSQQKQYRDTAIAYKEATKFSRGQQANREIFEKFLNDPEAMQQTLEKLSEKLGERRNRLPLAYRNYLDHPEKTAPETMRKIFEHLRDVLKLTPERAGIETAKFRPVHIEAIKRLAPQAFQNRPIEEHKQIARRLNDHLGIVRDTTFNQIINIYNGPDGKMLKAKIGQRKVQNEATFNAAQKAYANHAIEHNAKLKAIVEATTHDLEHGRWTDSQTGNENKGRAGIIFAQNLGSIDLLHHSLRSREISDPQTGQKRNVRVAMITGAQTGKERDKIRTAYQNGEIDVIVMTSAGEAGLNLQRAKTLHNYDQPATAKSHAQRIGRAVRLGQIGDVHLHDYVSDTDFEKRKQQTVVRKYELGEIYQAPVDHIDDTGLAHYLSRVRSEKEKT